MSTLLAILSDYDLSDPMQLTAAQKTLNILKESIPADEETGFDASGTSGPEILANGRGSSKGDDDSVSNKSQQAWRSQTDDTSLSQNISSLDLDGLESNDNILHGTIENREATCHNDFDPLNDSKETALASMFPALKPFDIKWTLKKCNGDVDLAIDELMTQAFFEQSGSRPRGIEAFSESEITSRPHKVKRKTNRARRNDDFAGSPTPETPIESKWKTGMQDVKFIASRTGLPLQQVSSLYHKHGASVHSTILSIIEAHMALKIESDDPLIQISAFELRHDFPAIPTSHLEALLQITHPSIPNTRDLAVAFTSHPTSKESGIKIELRRTPLDLGTEPIKTISNAQNAVYSSKPLDAAASVATYSQAKNLAYAQAGAAYRKGKSDPLMGGAAAYYSEVGRDMSSRLKVAESAAADALVARQTSKTQLDLHGVSVKDALRISREKVTNWWHESREDRIGGGGAGTGYKIVTGMGLHSEGGRGKLGPAVGKMLIREGWKIEVRGGYLLVIGVAKK